MRCGLILTRGKGETVVLHTSDGPICVTVTRIESDRVRIGFAAPDEVHIVRGELESGGGERYDAEFRDR